MPTHVAFLRGINVGGKNLIPMSALKRCFEEVGFKEVKTLIASGNVIFKPAPGFNADLSRNDAQELEHNDEGAGDADEEVGRVVKHQP